MPSIDTRLKAANADADASPSRTDRKSADAVFLSTANLSSELSRVNSTPLSSEAVVALGLPSSSSSSNSQDPLNEPSPLTMAPPKPSPADTLYPSPSGGFVPSPEEGQDWRLKPPPPGRTNKIAPPSSSTPLATLSLPTLKEASAQPSTSGLSPTTAASNPPTPTRPPSLPSCPETASKIANASSSSASRRSSQASNSLASPQLRPSSSSSSSRHRLSTAISPLESASTANDALQASSSRGSIASQSGREASLLRSVKSSRHNSTASYQTARNDNAKDDFTSIKVRDFAFSTDDPRHHGHPLVEPQSSADDSQDLDEHGQDANADEHEFYIEGAEDENEFDGDEGDNADVPEGVYNVLYQFDPVSEHELAVVPGDVVHVVGSLEGGWAIAIKDGDESVKGLVPATYLEWSAPLPE
ncbi:uncharacterized protein SPSC_04494 [Sporisorium scitamineum]|uniref:SH3 domain-containing protein n=1 Tax=Sporisorium scitamineum TaxID=49012 RepID=A0A0F7RS08_9BASI|nr:hypothetical protein [Sporisorium scitamineum]CDU24661.1 uncharacterized protein SPSC_04494 [Sporisorium scitamineum]